MPLLARDWRDQPQPDSAHHCPLCGTFHGTGSRCPDVTGDLVPGYADSADGLADQREQQRADGAR